MRQETIRYVPFPRIGEYLMLGWFVVADMGDYHGEWCCMMCWPCQCRCVEPKS